MVKGFAVMAIASSFALLGQASCDCDKNQIGDVSMLYSIELEPGCNCIDLRPPRQLMEQPLLTVDLDVLRWSNGIVALEESGMTLQQGDKIRFKVGGNPTTGYEWILNEDAA